MTNPAAGRPGVADKRRRFHDLHRSGCFVLPNPWDLGSARYLQQLGFQALASTSSGLAWSQARPDNQVPRDAVLVADGAAQEGHHAAAAGGDLAEGQRALR